MKVVMILEQGGVYWNVWKELFNFHKNYTGIKQTDEFWNKVYAEVIHLENKYEKTKATEFVNGVLIQILLELERQGQSDKEDE